ncbi:hypothetical protein MBOU_42120 [Mycobacterium bourgelatii]|uniref:Secreted protein n=1 Tax=Mycobacterium bourgelatii TaxID=1273442 RepID=A0A7I9YU01_MYCBU|nr:hypothetical protein MBOU_42120 [Mycobacterium bourgelatii]
MVVPVVSVVLAGSSWARAVLVVPAERALPPVLTVVPVVPVVPEGSSWATAVPVAPAGPVPRVLRRLE